MTRGQKVIIAVVAAIALLVGEAHFGSSRYYINGARYAVPHKYEFLRNFSLPWLVGLRGFDKEPEQSIWIMFPAKELARDIPGYGRWFHGYAGQVEAELVVNVMGGKEAREFPDDRRSDAAEVRQELSNGAPTRLDSKTGWTRVYWSVGTKGTPGEGNDLFYLIPRGGLARLPSNWRVPYCQSAPDMEGRETFHCHLTIYSSGATFGFYMRQENLKAAHRVPSYVWARLRSWQT